MLDRGVVVDLYTRAILTDVELVTIDGRVVMASFDTYLRFADAVDHLAVTGESLPN